MDLRRLRIGEWAMAAAGLVLLLSLLLPWYRPSDPSSGHEPGGVTGSAPLGDMSAWDAFAVTDVLLALLALAAIAALAVVARAVTPSPGVAYETLTLLVSIPCTIVCLFRVLVPPGEGLERASGAYLGLVAVLGVLATSLIAMRDERLSAPENPTDPTGVPVAAAPEIETLPAPRP